MELLVTGRWHFEEEFEVQLSLVCFLLGSCWSCGAYQPPGASAKHTACEEQGVLFLSSFSQWKT